MKIKVQYLLPFTSFAIMMSFGCGDRHEQFKYYTIDSGRSFIEEIFFQQKEKTTDTLLYLRYYIDNDSCLLKTAANLKIGISLTKRDQESGKAFNITYVGLKDRESNGALIKTNTSDGFRLTSFRDRGLAGKRNDAGVQILANGDDFIYVGELAGEMRLKRMGEFFSNEFKIITRNAECIQYRLVISHRNRAEIAESDICH